MNKGKQPAIKSDESSSTPSKPSKADDGKNAEEVQRLNMLVKQRDNEIGILLNYLNKKKEAGEDVGSIPVSRAPDASMVSNSTAAGNEASREMSSYESAPKREEQKSTANTVNTLYQMMTST